MLIYVELVGCDDTTTFPVEIKSEEERALLEKMVEDSKKYSEYSCMPVMNLITKEEKKEQDDFDAEMESLGR